MKEKREHPRFSVEELDLRTSTVVSTEVDIHDISPTGVAVSGSKRLNIGREYTLNFGGKDDMLPVKGIVKWEVLAGNRKASQEEVIPIYLAGIEFKDVLTEKAAHFIDFIKKIVGVKDKRLNGIRVKIRTHEKAVLRCMERYSVKLISLGGMLIETKHELPVEDAFPMELTFSDYDIPLHFKGKIACCQEVQTQGIRHYKTGIEFIDMEMGDKSRIEAFVDLLYGIFLVLCGKENIPIRLARLLMNQEWKYSFPLTMPTGRTRTVGISRSRIIRDRAYTLY